jgi:RimJ/RimL family protein N-acetyltransferase
VDETAVDETAVDETAVDETAVDETAVDETYGMWVDHDGSVTGGFSVTSPYPLLLEVVPEDALAPLVEEWGTRFPGVNAERAVAEHVAALWVAATGGSAAVRVETRLFLLGSPTQPDPVPVGYARSANPDDLDLLVAWTAAFHEETSGPRPGLDLPHTVRQQVRRDGYRLWCTPDGKPVSMAGLTRPAAGVVRVGPVYTPVDLRRHGYAAGATAAATTVALTRAEQVVLFTDLANPTSNALYPRLGFRPLLDRLTYTFTPTQGPPQSAP